MNEKILIDRSVAEQALEALREAQVLMERFQDEKLRRSAMKALRAALEQPPSSYPLPDELYDSKDWRAGGYAERVEWLHTMYESAKEQIAALCAVLEPQIEQEPVAWVKQNWQSDPWATAVMDEQKKRDVIRNDNASISGFSAAHTVPLYLHPQNLNCKSTQARLATLWGYVKEQPKREPLSDEQIDDLKVQATEAWRKANFRPALQTFVARAIEAAHSIGGEK